MVFASLRPCCLLVLAACAGAGVPARGTHLWHDPPARPAPGLVNVVVEIPAGTTAKLEVDHVRGVIRQEQRDGAPRTIDYLPYPASYGMVPRTLLPREAGGDGDPLDAVLLGPAVPSGTLARARVIAMLRLLDEGEADDKLVAVPAGEAHADLRDLASLDRRYPGARRILETFFAHYDGEGVTEVRGWADAAEANATVDRAAAAYAADAH